MNETKWSKKIFSIYIQCSMDNEIYILYKNFEGQYIKKTIWNKNTNICKWCGKVKK